MSTTFHPEEFTPVSTPETVKQTGEMNAQTGAMELSARDGATQPDRAKPAAGGMLRLFKVRNFPLLLGGQTISTFGDALYMVALPWLILTTGGNAEALGMVLAAYGIPRALCMLAGGWLSDRLRHGGSCCLLIRCACCSWESWRCWPLVVIRCSGSSARSRCRWVPWEAHSPPLPSPWYQIPWAKTISKLAMD